MRCSLLAISAVLIPGRLIGIEESGSRHCPCSRRPSLAMPNASEFIPSSRREEKIRKATGRFQTCRLNASLRSASCYMPAPCEGDRRVAGEKCSGQLPGRINAQLASKLFLTPDLCRSRVTRFLGEEIIRPSKVHSIWLQGRRSTLSHLKST